MGTLVEGLSPPRQKPRWLVFDTLDDRREIHQLLKRLPPARRVRFLEWCCSQSVLPNSQVQPRVSRTTRELADLACRDDSADLQLAYDVYQDVWHLASNYTFSIDAALAKLVEMVRKG